MNWKKKFTTIKVGDRVIKAKPYSTDMYIKYGGDSDTIPLGSVGIVREIYGRHLKIDICGYTKLNFDISELDLE